MPTTTLARTAFRRTPMTTGVIGQLNREWDHLRGTRTPASWPAPLSACPTVGDVLDQISSMSCPRDADPALHALLTLHAHGDTLAGRAVLQSMLGKVARMARTAHARRLPDPNNTALELMWAAVHTYPLNRVNSVAGNLALDALHQLRRRAAVQEIPISNLVDDRDVNADHVLECLLAGREAVDSAREIELREGRLVQALAWAGNHQALSPADVRLLARIHLGLGAARHNETMRTIAEELGVTHVALRKRHSRAVHALAGAVLERVAE